MIKAEKDTKDHTGYVLYANKSANALGVVSVDHKRKATTEQIPRFIKNSVIRIEDRRFYNHNGVDYTAVCRAIFVNFKNRKIVQGGSTLTQQLARNLIYNNKKTFSRKFLEWIKTIRLEFKYSKEEILDLYFNHVYWGNNLYGIRAASLYYYKKEPFQLTYAEQLSLLTLLRGPNYYLNNSEATKRRFHLLNDTLLNSTLSKSRHRKIANHSISFKNEFLQVFNNSCIPFITDSVNESTKTIATTIDSNYQFVLNKWVEDSIYPVTAICIEKGKVVAVSSTFGIAHAFSFRANVGSTLKPFIYAFLRSHQIEKNQLINTKNLNRMGWNVREVNFVKPYITLDEALFISNNNTFVNTCFDVGLNKLYAYLSLLLKKDISEFTPSSILGATKRGITLYELATYYDNFFCRNSKTLEVQECLQILQRVAVERLKSGIDNIFLKTGTTNDNTERYIVLGNQDRVLALVRGENPINDYSKEGNFLDSVKKLILPIFNKNATYRWNKR